MGYIYGRNPVIEALQHPEALQKIYILHGRQSGKVRQIYRLARQQQIAVANADSKKLRQMVGNVNHQGVVALVSPVTILPLAEYPARRTGAAGEFPGLMVADRIQDPHNMGAIIRSAEIFGADGLLFSTRETVPITDAVIKASAGAALHLPLYRADNLARAVDFLIEQQIWVYGGSPEGTTTLWELDFRRPCAIIVGNEEKGIRPLLQKKCDQLFRIPQIGATPSLNASVAAGVVLAEMMRQRSQHPTKNDD